MNIPAAYMLIIVIWTTTPLGIKWSGIETGYEFGVAARMLIGFTVLWLISRVLKLKFPFDAHARRVYIVSGLSLFMAMSLVYWSAQFIPSGWISVVFGLSPLFTSVFAAFILGSDSFAGGRLAGMLLGLAGLSMVFVEGMSISQAAWIGVTAATLAAMSQSLGAVMLKKLNTQIHALSVTMGGLLVALPLFVINALIAGIPEHVSTRAMSAIVYLALFGTSLGFPLYFYVLKNLSPERVALIALITPVTALLLGASLNGELITIQVWMGAAMVITGLAVYEYGHHVQWLWVKIKR